MGAALKGADGAALFVSRDSSSVPHSFSGNKIEFSTQFGYKYALRKMSKAILALPGGFGTLHLVSEYLVLMQLGIMRQTPIILLDKGNGYWDGLIKWIRNSPLNEKMVSKIHLAPLRKVKNASAAVDFIDTLPEVRLRMPDYQALLLNARDYCSDLELGASALERLNVPTVTFFGSSRLKEGDPYFDLTFSLSHDFATKGYGVVSGGGDGVMRAAALGAHQADGKAIGFIPKFLIEKEHLHGHYVEVVSMVSRKEILAHHSRPHCYMIMPGGFGTKDELFEVLSRQKRGEIPKAPVYLVGSGFYGELSEWLDSHVLKAGYISQKDSSLYSIVDSSALPLKHLGH
jgi:uncharacterized protein (TIGR00730 family)